MPVRVKLSMPMEEVRQKMDGWMGGSENKMRDPSEARKREKIEN